MAEASGESSESYEPPQPEELGSMHPSADGGAGVIPIGRPAGPGSPAARKAGDVINGQYKLERRVDLREGLEGKARGAFGEVWKASYLIALGERGDASSDARGKSTSEPRAVKFIQPERADPKTLQRFTVTEPRALARLSHPFIARFHEFGWHGSDPFLVMEFVRGGSITTYADQERLTLDQRIDLVIKVCEAVQHVHSQGLVHRDLKPDNILITEVDGGGDLKAGERADARAPIPKLIDFGLAKSTNAEPLDRSIASEVSFVGSRPYASPEQFTRRAHEEVDRAADVYAIGAILFELICGISPMHHVLIDPASSAAEKAASFASDERPSLLEAFRRLSAADQQRIAAARRTTPRGLRFVLRGSLQWIQSAALRVEPKARISDVSKLREDLRNYLEGQPLRYVTREPWFTRTARRVRRRPVPYAATAAVILALAIGLAGTVWQKNVADRQRVRADERAAAAEKAERAERERADQLRQVSEFQSRMLREISTTRAGAALMMDIRSRFATALQRSGVPEVDREPRVVALARDLALVNATDVAASMINGTILEPAILALGEQFKDQPLVVAQLQLSLATLYRAIGLSDAAIPLLQSALDVRGRLLGERHRDTLKCINAMGSTLADLGRFNEAESYLREAMDKGKEALGEKDPDTLASVGNFGGVLVLQGRLSEAETYVRTALEGRRNVLGEGHPDSLTSATDLGILLQQRGKLEEAAPLLRDALQGRRIVLGGDHPNTLMSLNALAFLLQSQRRLAEAEPLYREALEKRRRVLGEEHPDTLTSINNMAFLLKAQGNLREAEPLLREALDKCGRVLGETHPKTLTVTSSLGGLLVSKGSYAEAEPLLRGTLAARRSVLGERHPDTLTSINNLAFLLLAQGNVAEAEVCLRDAMETSQAIHGLEHPATLTIVHSLGRVLQQQSKYQQACDLLGPSEAAARRVFTDANAPQLAGFLIDLGIARAGLGSDRERCALAERNLLDGHAILSRVDGNTRRETARCIQSLIDLYTSWDQAEPGTGYDLKAAEWRAKLDEARVSDPPGR